MRCPRWARRELSTVFRFALILTAALAGCILGEPGVALANARWSAPESVFPAAPSDYVLPSVFVDPGGATLALTSDARGPTVAVGDAAGHFAAAQPVAAGEGAADEVAGAVGADGTLAVEWATGGAVKVAVRAAGATFGAPITLAGAHGDSPALAVTPDGGVVAVWRHKTGRGRPTARYVIKVAGASPGARFAAAQSFDAGGLPVDTPLATASSDGTVAVGWRRAVLGERVRVSVRPPGGRFAEPLTVSPTAGHPLDTDVSLAFAGDGTLAAGWANELGTFVAVRPAGGSFGAPQPLTRARELGYGVDVAGGPGGALAAGWDNDATGDLRVADGSAAGFSPGGEIARSVSPAGSRFTTSVQLAFDSAGDLFATWRRASDGVVEAAMRPAGGAFGAPTALGYGAGPGWFASALAAGPDGRAVVIWRVRDYSVAAASFGEQAETRPGTDLPALTPPPGDDERAPRVTVVGGPTVQLDRGGRFTLHVRGDERCSLAAAGRLLLGQGTPLIAPRPNKPRSGTQAVKLRLNAGSLRQAIARLRRGGRVRARVQIAASDVARNTSITPLTITLG